MDLWASVGQRTPEAPPQVQRVLDPTQIRYSVYWILYRSDTARIGSYTDPIQRVLDPIQIRYSGIRYSVY